MHKSGVSLLCGNLRHQEVWIILKGEGRRSMKRKPSYFYKILVLFLITVLTTSCVLTVFSYRQLSDSLKSKVWADYQAALRKNAQTWSDLTSEIGQLNQAIVLEPQTESFFSMESFDPVQDYNTYLRVKKMFNINPFMVAVCLYNEKADYGLYCGTDNIPLKELWNRMGERNGKTVSLVERTDNGAPILVFGYPYYLDSFSHPQGGVFLALDGSLIATHVFGKKECRQMILAEDGELLLSGENGTPVILQWPGSYQEGNEILSVLGKDYLCSTYRQEDLSFISYEEEETVMEPLARQRNVFLLVCLLVMAISACLQFWIVKRIYQPIASIKETFAKSRFADGSVKGEFELIRQVYEEAVARIRVLEEKDASKLKEDTLRGLLTGRIEPDRAKEIILEYGWEIPFSGMFLIDIQTDYSQGNHLQRSMVQARMKELLSERLSTLFCVEVVSGFDDETVAMINTRKEGNATFENLVEGLCGIRDELLSEHEIAMTIGLDGVITDLEDCREIYEKVRRLQKNRFALGENQVIYPARVMELLPKPLTWPDPLMREVLAAYRKGDGKLFGWKIADFIDTISQYEYASASLMFARLVLEMAACWQSAGSEGNIPAIELKTNPATKKEAEEILWESFAVFEKQKAQTQQMKGNRHYKKMMEGQQFIMEHYWDCSLSVDMVAEELGYSSNYFARLFKSITGFYVNDYIRQVRIMKAQEFLKGTQMTVNDIAKETGFTTPNYFYSIFKRETGMTPASFREGTKEGEV